MVDEILCKRAYIQNISHFSFMIFCLFVIYYLYLLLLDSPSSLVWLIEMDVFLAFIHIGAWFWVSVSNNFQFHCISFAFGC
jgi:hypothetical protein